MTEIEKLEMNVEGKFWTNQNEMIDELEDLGYEVVEAGWERLVVVDTYDEDEPQYSLMIGHANRTMWITEVNEEG